MLTFLKTNSLTLVFILIYLVGLIINLRAGNGFYSLVWGLLCLVNSFRLYRTWTAGRKK